MHAVVKPGENAMGFRPEWMPDPGIYAFVLDLLSAMVKEHHIDVDILNLPEHWIPLGIVGTTDWLQICAWWIWENVGIFDTEENYRNIFDYDGYEFSLDELLVYREDIKHQKEMFEERLLNPGITSNERSEAFKFLEKDVYGAWEMDAPPTYIMEWIMWATMVWMLSDNGKDWLYNQDPLFSSVFDFGVSFLTAWADEVLDPQIMFKTPRPRENCRYCTQTLYCVRGYLVDQSWHFVCNHCAVELSTNDMVSKEDKRVKDPMCGNQLCLNTACKHMGMTQADVNDLMRANYTERRLSQWEEYKARLGGQSPRVALGQTSDDIINHFKR